MGGSSLLTRGGRSHGAHSVLLAPGCCSLGRGEKQLLSMGETPLFLWLPDEAVAQRWWFGSWSPGELGGEEKQSSWPGWARLLLTAPGLTLALC